MSHHRTQERIRLQEQDVISYSDINTEGDRLCVGHLLFCICRCGYLPLRGSAPAGMENDPVLYPWRRTYVLLQDLRTVTDSRAQQNSSFSLYMCQQEGMTGPPKSRTCFTLNFRTWVMKYAYVCLFPE